MKGLRRSKRENSLMHTGRMIQPLSCRYFSCSLNTLQLNLITEASPLLPVKKVPPSPKEAKAGDSLFCLATTCSVAIQLGIPQMNCVWGKTLHQKSWDLRIFCLRSNVRQCCCFCYVSISHPHSLPLSPSVTCIHRCSLTYTRMRSHTQSPSLSLSPLSKWRGTCTEWVVTSSK